MNLNLNFKKYTPPVKVVADFRMSGIARAVKLIIGEYNQTITRNDPLESSYEGWALIKQEVDELWAEIKKGKLNGSQEELQREAVQISAMAMRFVVELCLEEKLSKTNIQAN